MGVEGHDLVHHPRRLGQVTSLITSHHRLDIGLVVRFTGHSQRRRGLAENSEPRVSRLVYDNSSKVERKWKHRLSSSEPEVKSRKYQGKQEQV